MKFNKTLPNDVVSFEQPGTVDSSISVVCKSFMFGTHSGARTPDTILSVLLQLLGKLLEQRICSNLSVEDEPFYRRVLLPMEANKKL